MTITTNFSQLLRRYEAETAAFRVLVGALLASHPEPEKLRQQIAELSALQMTALASSSRYASDDFRQDVNEQFSKLLEVMLKQIPGA
jgi:hypothetical protein